MLAKKLVSNMDEPFVYTIANTGALGWNFVDNSWTSAGDTSFSPTLELSDGATLSNEARVIVILFGRCYTADSSDPTVSSITATDDDSNAITFTQVTESSPVAYGTLTNKFFVYISNETVDPELAGGNNNLNMSVTWSQNMTEHFAAAISIIEFENKSAPVWLIDTAADSSTTGVTVNTINDGLVLTMFFTQDSADYMPDDLTNCSAIYINSIGESTGSDYLGLDITGDLLGNDGTNLGALYDVTAPTETVNHLTSDSNTRHIFALSVF